jgi:cytochrome c oxidase subunit III
MNPDNALMTDEEVQSLEHTVLARHLLESQYHDLDQQREAATLGIWIFLATEVMFFGALFLAVFVNRSLYPEEFEHASTRLNWMIGGINTLVLLLSSLMIVLAVHYAKHGKRNRVVAFLGLTAFLGLCFLCFKGVEYYGDYVENLIPGWRFNNEDWTGPGGLRPDQVPHVKLFLFLYWVMTLLHGLHVTIGIGVVLVIMASAWRGRYSPEYYTPVDVTALYWHFVDVVWIFLLPTLYLLGTHHW